MKPTPLLLAAALSSTAPVGARSLHALEMPCLTQSACLARSEEIGAASFHIVQNAPTKGCTAKNGRVFWSPGTEAEMSTAEASGTSVRLWCDGHPEPTAAPSVSLGPTGAPSASPIAPTGSPSSSPSASKSPTPKPTTRAEGIGNALAGFAKDFACTTRAACRKRSEEMGMPFRVVKAESKGCFTKNGNAFWSLGTIDQMSTAELPGVQARLWCEYSGEAPLVGIPSDVTDSNGTVATSPSTPANQPTWPPLSTSNQTSEDAATSEDATAGGDDPSRATEGEGESSSASFSLSFTCGLIATLASLIVWGM